MDVSSAAQTFGFPAACLVAVCIAIWRALAWAGIRGDKLLARHIDFIDAVQKAVVDQADNQREQAESLKRQVQILEEQTGLLKKIGAASTAQTKMMAGEQKSDNGSH